MAVTVPDVGTPLGSGPTTLAFEVNVWTPVPAASFTGRRPEADVAGINWADTVTDDGVPDGTDVFRTAEPCSVDPAGWVALALVATSAVTAAGATSPATTSARTRFDRLWRRTLSMFILCPFIRGSTR